MTSGSAQLSERELETLKLVAQGRSNQQIANDMGISINTVKVHLRNIYGKTGTASRTEASMYAVRTGLVNVLPPLIEAEDEGVSLIPEPSEPPVNGTATTSIVTEPFAVEAQPQAERQPLIPVEPVAIPSFVRSGLAPRTRYARVAGVLIGVLILATLVILLQQRQPPAAVIPPGGDLVFSELTQDWILRQQVPTTQMGTTAAVVDRKIYLIGGQQDGQASGSLTRYDAEQNVLTQLAPMSTAVEDVQAVVVGGKVYVPGGKRADGTLSADVQVYDPQAGAWSTAKQLPEPRSGYALATNEGRIYLFGGTDGQAARKEAFVFDPTSDTWTKLPDMLTARVYASAVEQEGNLYVTGGEDTQARPLNTHEMYAPVNQEWMTRAPMLQARSKFGMGTFGYLIYVFGGTGENTLQIYNIGSDNWETATQAPPTTVGLQPAVAQRGDLSLFVFSRGEGQAPNQLFELNSKFVTRLQTK